MAIAAVEVITDVSPNNSAISTEPDQNMNAIALTEQEIANLPDNEDDLRDYLNALAGGGVNGQGANILVDGFNGGRLPPREAIAAHRLQPEHVFGRVFQSWFRTRGDHHQARLRRMARQRQFRLSQRRARCAQRLRPHQTEPDAAALRFLHGRAAAQETPLDVALRQPAGHRTEAHRPSSKPSAKISPTWSSDPTCPAKPSGHPSAGALII